MSDENFFFMPSL